MNNLSGMPKHPGGIWCFKTVVFQYARLPLDLPYGG